VSREHEALEERRMALFTSRTSERGKEEKLGGGKEESESGEKGEELESKEVTSFETFWWKKLRKEVARESDEVELGRTQGVFRERSELRIDQSFLG